jgi:2-keto-4-pentenoate hydratase
MTFPRERSLGMVARRLWQAEQAGIVTQRLTAMLPDLTLDEAYVVRREVDLLRMATGAIPVGRKIGLASRELLARAGVDEPYWAYIFDNGVVQNGATLDLSRYFRVRLEPEIALVLGKDLSERPVGRTQVASAIRGVHPAFELVDIRTDIEGLQVAEAIADSGWNAGYVLGEGVPADGVDLDAIGVRVSSQRSGPLSALGRADMLLDGPLGCLTWLAERLIADGEPLRAGEIVLTGTLAGAIPIAAGETVTAEFSGIGDEPLVVHLSGL